MASIDYYTDNGVFSAVKKQGENNIRKMFFPDSSLEDIKAFSDRYFINDEPKTAKDVFDLFCTKENISKFKKAQETENIGA